MKLKNKKGFTLVELLAVIAILAILIIFAIPNVLNIFKNSKKQSFVNEVKVIYNEVSKKFLQDQINDSNNNCYCSAGENKLNINASNNLKYCVSVDNDGKILSMIVANEEYMLDLSEFNIYDIDENNVEIAPEGGIEANTCSSHSSGGTFTQNATGPVLSTIFNASDTTNFGVYTGEHKDTYGTEGNEPIIYFKTATNNNVIFADHCWQMIRTTSSGGVRLLYNGKQVNNQCLTDRGSTNLGYDSETTSALSSPYYYADDYNFDGTNFSLVNPVEATWSDSTKDNLIGKYTCKGASATGTCTTLYLVSRYNSNTSAYVIPIKNNSHYSQFGALQFNSQYNSPAYVGYKYGKVYPGLSKTPTSTMRYGTSVTYTGNTYTLQNVSETIDANHHFMCENGTTCSTVYYVNYSSGTNQYGMAISDGETDINKILSNMLDTNTNDSTMKIGLEAWYKKYLLSYDNFIEQKAIYCNRRDVKTLNAFNPNGGSLTGYLKFEDYDVNSDLSCSDTKDQFSKNNLNATLNYPIGLMTLPEANIIQAAVRNSGNYYWLGSACYFNLSSAAGRYVVSSGGLSSDYVYHAYGLRGVVSIRPGVKVVDGGDGTLENPYRIE